VGFEYLKTRLQAGRWASQEILRGILTTGVEFSETRGKTVSVA
jgi:hypothetical protein